MDDEDMLDPVNFLISYLFFSFSYSLFICHKIIQHFTTQNGNNMELKKKSKLQGDLKETMGLTMSQVSSI